MFGGRFLPPKGDKACAKSKSGFDCEFVYLNDLWFYDPARDEWARGQVRGKLSPAKRDHHATAYVDGNLYVHGGKLTDQATSALKDLWRYDLVGRTWSEMHPAVAPSSRYLHNMAAWPGGHAIVLFGGETRAEIDISAPMAGSLVTSAQASTSSRGRAARRSMQGSTTSGPSRRKPGTGRTL